MHRSEQSSHVYLAEPIVSKLSNPVNDVDLTLCIRDGYASDPANSGVLGK